MKLKDIEIEYQKNPIGLDEKVPRFSWQYEVDEQEIVQKLYQIRVTNVETAEVVWETEPIVGQQMSEIEYKGKALQPCTRYQVKVSVWDEDGRRAEQKGNFETGLLNPKITAWEGAEWIAAPFYTVRNRTRGVFCIEASFLMTKGATRAGIVFGAGDYRLENHSLNEYGIEGENYIRYEMNVQDSKHDFLDIYRVGYAPEDSDQKPFARIEISSKKVCWKQFHTLQIKVTGNQGTAYLDGIQIGETITLNPRGGNDVLTYPRLNKIGFFAGKGGKVLFQNLTVSNIRTPGAVYIDERPQKSLYDRPSVFSAYMKKENGCFVLEDGQIALDTSNTSIPMFRRTFSVTKKMKKARLYITSRGIYECRINGKELTENRLMPGLTQYDKRLQYQTYDITKFLQFGENAIGVILSSGWWSDAQTFTVCNYNYFGDKEALLCKLVLSYEDGTCETIVSDTKNWLYYGEGPIEYAGLFQGEQYNAQKQECLEKFLCTDFVDKDWVHPVSFQVSPIEEFDAGFARKWPAVNQSVPLLVGGYDAPVSIVEKRKAVKRIRQEEKVFIYDFEQEMAGVPRIVFHEPKGTVIYIRYGEMLYPDLPEYERNIGKMMRENYRDAESVDVYICRGDAQGEVYQPRFTFHGFRYLELNGVTHVPQLFEVEALQYSSISEFDGKLISSDMLLNRFVENVHWSQLCNFISIPTDCPQRNERMGWAGDTHVFCNTALHNSNLKLFYERSLQAFADLQEKNGRYPEIAPIGGGFGGITYECAPIFIAWELYQQYGDKRILEKYYSGMRRYMNYMKNSGLPGIGKEEMVGPLSDWLAFEETDSQLMWNAFYYREAVLMEKIAHVLKNRRDEEEYHALKECIQTYWNQTFVCADSKKTRSVDGTLCDTQTSYALAIEYQIAWNTQQMGEHLARKVRENNYRVGTGFFGTGLLNRALSKTGHNSEACRLMSQTAFPSWLYPVTQGATTIWEHWDSYTKEKGFGSYNSMNSFNHYSLGSVVSWLYDTVLGITRLEDYPGFMRFELHPLIDNWSSIRGRVASPHGVIESGWEQVDQKVYYTCQIPGNTNATLFLPDGRVFVLKSGIHTFEIMKK